MLQKSHGIIVAVKRLVLGYIHDIVEDINSVIRLFTDDTSLYLKANTPVQKRT